MTTYATSDSRLAAFFLLHGVKFENTEVLDKNGDDRVSLRFSFESEERLAELKRGFFEGATVPALTFANSLKTTMHMIRQAREMAREGRQ
jgi:hypothetical protein